MASGVPDFSLSAEPFAACRGALLVTPNILPSGCAEMCAEVIGMLRQRVWTWPFGAAWGLGLVVLAGCSRPTTPSPEAQIATPAAASSPAAEVPTAAVVAAPSEDHGHKPGEHGGILVSLGRDSYHVEAVFEAGGKLRLYTLGKDESRVIDVESQTLKGFVKPVGGTDAIPVLFAAEPQDGDARGRTSQFIGTLPDQLVGKPVVVTIPNLVVSGERFRLGFESNAAAHGEGMPGKVADEEERALYLTPGGIYTQADIAANGGVTASQKFRGLMSSHDMLPKAGDRICPITSTKATPNFSWVVDGKTYEFCCPPCVDEFVKLAKVDPSAVKPPSEYIKR